MGIASDYGTALRIGRVHPADQILYQTERYHEEDFSYKIPVKEDGDYVLVLKFCEVWFNAPHQKVCRLFSIVRIMHQYFQLNSLNSSIKAIRSINYYVNKYAKHWKVLIFTLKYYSRPIKLSNINLNHEVNSNSSTQTPMKY